MKKIKMIIWIMGFMLPVLPVNAQRILSIDTLFANYGKQKGSIMIELAKDVLDGHTQIERYKCLIADANPEIIRQVETALQSDFSEENRYAYQNVLKEIKEDGKIRTVYYVFVREKFSSVWEYILYTNKNKKFTLIYLKGDFPDALLDEELKKLKNLFIEINN
jgi:hypothetical protein